MKIKTWQILVHKYWIYRVVPQPQAAEGQIVAQYLCARLFPQEFLGPLHKSFVTSWFAAYVENIGSLLPAAQGSLRYTFCIRVCTGSVMSDTISWMKVYYCCHGLRTPIKMLLHFSLIALGNAFHIEWLYYKYWLWRCAFQSHSTKFFTSFFNALLMSCSVYRIALRAAVQ